MQSFWNRINSTYDLNIGEEKLSPLLTCSIGLSLDYIEKVKHGIENSAFCLCFPEKHESAIWISLAILKNSFLEDYVFQSDNRIKFLGLQRNDLIEIFNCTARYQSHDGKKINLSFKDGSYSLSNKIASHINRSSHNKLNNLSLFQERRRQQRKDRNLISKLLEPNEQTFINNEILDSKVLIVTGRGNLSKMKERFLSTIIYGESIAETFGLGTNLLLTPDLDMFVNSFDQDLMIKANNFKQFFLANYDQIKSEIISKPIGGKFEKLKILVELDEFLTEGFNNIYEECLEELDRDEFESVFFVSEKYPGPIQLVPDKLRAVIVNDITLVDLYPNTVSNLLKKNIPVIVICDRLVTLNTDISFYSNFFQHFPDIPRINWTQAKIKSLSEFDVHTKYLDDALWQKCKRYSNQKIRIETFPGHPLDLVITELQKQIMNLEGFEKLKLSYWKWLYPAIYALKNDPLPNTNAVHNLIRPFEETINELRTALKNDMIEQIDRTIELLKGDMSNTKKIESYNFIFYQYLSTIGNVDIIIPSHFPKKTFNLNDSIDEIIFPGFPFNESLNSSLINSVSKHFVPSITILTWPHEGALTYQYLTRRIMGSYFIDNKLEKFGFPKYLILDNEQNIYDEVKNIFQRNILPISTTLIDESENVLYQLSRYKFNSYKQSEGDGSTFQVKSNIIHLDDDHFMFLPHNSKVLAQTETGEGALKIKRILFSELQNGYRIFTFRLDKSDRRELLKKSLTSITILEELHIWKQELDRLFEKERNINGLETLLRKTKDANGLGGNPSKYNISRWLHDDELLSPDDDNVTLILTAAQNENIAGNMTKIRKAYREVNGFNIHLSSQIKRQLTNELSNNLTKVIASSFKVILSGVEVNIECRSVTGLQKDTFEVDYSDTRKFLN